MNSNNKILLIFVIIKFVLQYALLGPGYDLHRDEYLHLDQGRHLAWGYISVPPFTSWISYIIGFLGNGVFWVKFFPALFGAGTMVLVCKTIEELKGGRFALITGALAILLSVLLRMNMLYQPNSLDIFFWTLVYFTLIKCISTGNTKWLVATGVAIAFGFLSKYNIIFLVSGLLPAVLLTPQRKWLLNKHFYIGLIIAIVIVFPNILWQYNNNFPTFRQLKELADTQLVNVSRVDFLKDQLIYFLSVIILVFAGFAGLFRYPPFKPFRFLFYGYCFSLALFIALKAKSYYAVGLYPIFIAFGSVYLEKLSIAGWKKYLRPVVVLWVVLFSVPFIWLAFPIKSPQEIRRSSHPYTTLGLLRWEDGKNHELPQDFADMLGWREMAAKTDSIYNTFPDKKNVLVLCDNYGQAGAINYYSAFKKINAVTYNADYINWFRLDKKIKHIILLQYADDDDPERTKEKPWFDTIYVAGKINNPFAREFGTTIYVLKNATVDINKIIEGEIRGMR